MWTTLGFMLAMKRRNGVPAHHTLMWEGGELYTEHCCQPCACTNQVFFRGLLEGVASYYSGKEKCHPPPTGALWRCFLFCFWKTLLIFREEKGGRKGEKHQCVVASCTHPLLGTWLTTQACALTGNGTHNTLIHRLALNSLSHTSQGLKVFFSSMSVILPVKGSDFQGCFSTPCKSVLPENNLATLL